MTSPSVTGLYKALHRKRVVDLLGAWVSELEPVVFTRVDVAPHVLAEIGIGAEGDATPRFVAQITAEAMLDAMRELKRADGSGSRPEPTPVPNHQHAGVDTAGAHSRKPETLQP